MPNFPTIIVHSISTTISILIWYHYKFKSQSKLSVTFSINEKLCFFFDASDRLDFHHTVVTTLIFVYKYSIPLRYCFFHFLYSLNKCARHVTLISRNCTTKGERILKLYPGKFSRVESTRS